MFSHSRTREMSTVSKPTPFTKGSFQILSKQEEKIILDFCSKQFKKHSQYPNIQQVKRFADSNFNRSVPVHQLKRVRNKLFFISKYRPLGETGHHRNHAFEGLKVGTIGWIELDIMFLNQGGKPYGQAIVVVDILTKMVYAESVSDKSLPSVIQFIKNLIKVPGFTNVRCVLSDQESALKSLSRNNKEFPNIKFFITDKKAKTVERTIRSIKNILSKIMIQNNESTLYRWKNYLPQVLLKLNTKKLPGKIPGELDVVRPIDLNKRNCQKYVEYLLYNNKNYYKKHHLLLTPQNPELAEKIFRFKINDAVYLARKLYEKSSKNLKFQKPSILGHFTTKEKFIVSGRKLTVSSTGYIIPIYRIETAENSDEIDKNILDNVYERYLRHYPNFKPNPRNIF